MAEEITQRFYRESEDTQRHPRTPKQPRRGRRLSSLLLGMMIGLVVFVFLCGLTLVVGGYGYYQWFGLILPGVHVGDVYLGGMSVNDAANRLQEVWSTEQGIILTDGTRRWAARPSDFGLSLDPVATAQQAYNVGHGQDVVSEMMVMLDSMVNDTAIAPVAQVDPEAARAGLNTWAETINLPPQDASIRIEGGQVVAVPGAPGYTLDVERTLAMLVADPSAALGDGALHLMLITVPPRIQDVGNAAAEAERLLASDLAIRGYDPISNEQFQWPAPRETIASWLAIVEGVAGPEVVVDHDRLESYLSEIGSSLGVERYFDAEESVALIEEALRNRSLDVVLIVKHAPTTYVVQPGDTLTSIAWEVGIPYWRILGANPGLAPGNLAVEQLLNIPSPDDLLPLPIVPNKRIVISIGEQRLWAYENDTVVYEYIISTGIDRSPTQPGVFQVQTHELTAYAAIWDLTMPHFIGIYEAWPGFMNGLHGLPTLSSGQILWADVLGRPASYGCIILDLDAAETLYDWAENGVVVEIVE